MKLYKKSKTLEYLHEFLFSLNFALFFFALFLQYAPLSWHSVLTRVEFAMNGLFHARQTDSPAGYWELFLPAIAMTVCIWILLRLFSDYHATRTILRVPAGITAVVLAPTWLFIVDVHLYGLGIPQAIELCELLAALLCVILYSLRGSFIRRQWILVALISHTAFWFWQFRPFVKTLFRGWGGAVAITPVVGFCATLAWLFYLAHDSSSEPPLAADSVASPSPLC